MKIWIIVGVAVVAIVAILILLGLRNPDMRHSDDVPPDRTWWQWVLELIFWWT